MSYGLLTAYENNLLNHDLDRPAILAVFFSDLRRLDVTRTTSIRPRFRLESGGGKTVIRGGGGIFHDSNLFWTRLVERAYTGPSGNGRYIIPGSFFPTDRIIGPQNPHAYRDRR